MTTKKHRKYKVWLASAILLLLIVQGFYHRYKPLQQGLNFSGAPRPVTDLSFLTDISYLDSAGNRQIEQSIFDQVFSMIDAAEKLVLVDMFLFNPYQGAGSETHRALSEELTFRLIAKKRDNPQLPVILITDPFNTLYGGLPSEQMEALQQAGVSLTYTELTALRDSNPLYSAIWRSFVRYWGNGTGGLLPNPVGEGKVSLRTYLALLNFKANHRKVVIADQNGQLFALVTSANPHDGSSAHGNVALRFGGPAVQDLIDTELAVLRMSNADTGPLEAAIAPFQFLSGLTESEQIQVFTERAIEVALIESINSSQSGDQLDIAVFYLSDRHVLKAMLDAHSRGVQIRVLLDPNKDAFGRRKNGIPNRQTAHELHSAGVPVRWCDTHGEQCHSKFLLVRQADGEARLILGSANFTRRNLDNLNLETSVRLSASVYHPIMSEAADWFDMRWSNGSERQFSLAYEEYADESIWRRIMYRFMEASGLSTF